ncbi:NPCBM/NEW2 domain-containing protein [Emticicia sp. SJ17W-69]|uniref:NPCBM/NEW2 domain-containing protein n=1 Tax=Emticicia sp. SJ17W-69 TaxID=3421657 RepID=UPI003EB7BC5C
MIRSFTIFIITIILASINVEAQLPDGFVDQLHSSDWQAPTGLTFDASGKMYVWEKDGRVYIVKNNEKTLFIDISEEVATYGDYGILGFALDPNFMTNGYVYLYYIVDRYYLLHYGEEEYDPYMSWEGATIARVTRYTAPQPAIPNAVDYKSRLVLIGETKSTGFPITGTNHGGGGMAFANDGTLFVSCGDGGLGADYDADALADGIITEAENVEDRVYRCQLINSLNGKIVRIDPKTGNGLSNNPYFDAEHPRSAQSRVWALGFRNPFRIAVKPNSGMPGILYVGDVGWNSREEVNIVTMKGQNFGWPIYEGLDLITPWTNPIYIPESYQKPIVEWSHIDENSPTVGTAKVLINNIISEVGSTEFPGLSFSGSCSIGGVWYKGTTYPEEFKNTYIFADFTSGWIKSFSFDNNENPTSFRNLHTSAVGAVGMAYNPVDESIYYLKLGFNQSDPIEIRKISYGISNVPPVAKFTLTSSYGVSPLSISFDASASNDYENANLTYTWDFGDGNTDTGINVTHVYDNHSAEPQIYEVFLTVTDQEGLSNTTSTVISLNNTPPIIHSTSVDSVNVFSNNNNDLISLSAQVSDNEELTNHLTYRWMVRLYHDEHSHPQLDVTRATSQVSLGQVPCDGHLYFYRVTLIVSDSYGLSATYIKDIYPNCSPSDTIPPEIPILKSFDSKIKSFKLSWNNVYDNVGVNSYEVFINGISQGLLNAQTLSYQYISATSIINKVFECYIKVRDLAGNISISSKLKFTHSSSFERAIVYLSDLLPSSIINGFGPIEIDHSNGQDEVNDGSIITLNGVTYSKGIGVHAGSEIIYDIPAHTYKTFSVKIGIDDEIADGDCGSVIFKVYKDDTLAFASPTMFPNSTTIDIQLDISNTAQLKLVAEFSGDDYFCDHGDWADAKLFKLNVSTDTLPPTTPTKLSYFKRTNYFQIDWDASKDESDADLDYEIIIDDELFTTTTALKSPLPVLSQGIHTVAIQAKDDDNNRAISNSIRIDYGLCQPSMELLFSSDNFFNNTIILKTSEIITANNSVLGTSKVTYQAGNKIELLPGFSATSGSVFTAQIQGCNN